MVKVVRPTWECRAQSQPGESSGCSFSFSLDIQAAHIEEEVNTGPFSSYNHPLPSRYTLYRHRCRGCTEEPEFKLGKLDRAKVQTERPSADEGAEKGGSSIWWFWVQTLHRLRKLEAPEPPPTATQIGYDPIYFVVSCRPFPLDHVQSLLSSHLVILPRDLPSSPLTSFSLRLRSVVHIASIHNHIYALSRECGIENGVSTVERRLRQHHSNGN